MGVLLGSGLGEAVRVGVNVGVEVLVSSGVLVLSSGRSGVGLISGVAAMSVAEGKRDSDWVKLVQPTSSRLSTRSAKNSLNLNGRWGENITAIKLVCRYLVISYYPYTQPVIIVEAIMAQPALFSDTPKVPLQMSVL